MLLITENILVTCGQWCSVDCFATVCGNLHFSFFLPFCSIVLDVGLKFLLVMALSL